MYNAVCTVYTKNKKTSFSKPQQQHRQQEIKQMKTNVMFYHTSDKTPSVVAQCETKGEAVEEMKRLAKEVRKPYNCTVIKSDGRIEFRCSTYGFAYYTEQA
jgi:hypothetical protein